jgi:hypothetical protein
MIDIEQATSTIDWKDKEIEDAEIVHGKEQTRAGSS